MADLPSSLDMGPHTYEVRCDPETSQLLHDEDCNGDSRPDRLLIRVNTERPHTAIAETLLHELLHCAWHQSGIHADEKPDEEIVVTALAPRILEALRRNPDLTRYLTDTPHRRTP